MAGEVIARQEQVVQRTWLGEEELQRLITKHENQPTDCLEDARDEKLLLAGIRRRALAAADYFTLTNEEAELIGCIVDRSFFTHWQAEFAAEYGAGK